MASSFSEPYTRFSAHIASHGDDSFSWEGDINTRNLLVLANGGDTPTPARAVQLSGAVAELRKRLERGETVVTDTATICPRRA